MPGLGNAPVEKVGGNQDTGPWPEHVEEIATGEAYQRPVVTESGVHQVTATVKDIVPVTDEHGNDTGGRAVVISYPDPEVDS